MANNNQQAFFELMRAGLWEKEARLSQFDKVDYEEIMRLAEEQAVVGLVTAGMEHIVDAKVPQMDLLQFVGQSLHLEQTNSTMNTFIAKIVGKMQKAGIYALLVKGQGIAQCYERPQWRTSGDVDFFLSKDNFEKAKDFFLPLSSCNKPDRQYSKELGLTIDNWLVELHGSLRTGLSSRVDKIIDLVQRDVFYGGNVRAWQNGETTVFIPAVDNDVFFVFTHFLKHFYKERGVTLRQMCDWCRLLWKFRESVNHRLLEARIRKAGLMSEWRAFSALALDWLGMPGEAMPMYSADKKWSEKAEKIVTFILKGGEWHKFSDTMYVGNIFPLNTLRFASGILLNVNWLKIKERVFGDGNR